MVKRYDAGLLSDYGGGNVEWWQDYIRAEIDRCNDYWEDEIAALRARLADYKQTFDLIHQAEIRGVEMFREAHPEYAEKLAHPSTDRLICWLLEQLAAYESRDETWRGKKEMLENDLAKAWERVERAERVLGIVGRMRERVLNRPPGVIIPMWVHDAIEEAEAVRGPEGEDERD